MKLSTLLEAETLCRQVIICDRERHEIVTKNLFEALTLPSDLLERSVVCYECPQNEAYPVRVTVAGSLIGIRQYIPKKASGLIPPTKR